MVSFGSDWTRYTAWRKQRVDCEWSLKTHKEIQLTLNMTCSLFPAKETNTDLALGYIPVSAHNLWLVYFRQNSSKRRNRIRAILHGSTSIHFTHQRLKNAVKESISIHYNFLLSDRSQTSSCKFWSYILPLLITCDSVSSYHQRMKNAERINFYPLQFL